MKTTPQRLLVDGFCTMSLSSARFNQQTNRAKLVFDVQSNDREAISILKKVASGLNAVTYSCVNPTKKQVELTVKLSPGTMSPPDKVQTFVEDFIKAVRAEVRGTNPLDMFWRQHFADA